ncbi:hypothetical protein L0665_07215 [Methanogenium marinum]|uniref:PGF-CTERM sorting domain-containing protein n=1 Tax=Methanogenium marinum TaxID=348610 RepID=A0A9Q4KVK5_9EURY|nr:hypothetical protein [Methanogenium marinum]MDE4908400.1 hypothetical protein [Methanogenium marinum]
MTRQYMMKVLIILLIAMCIVMPAAAVELEEMYLGTVTKADNASGALDVKISAQWNGEQFAPVTPVTIIGTSTLDVLFDNIKVGDEVVGTLMGGEKWIAVGLVGSKQSTQKQLLWMAGDPNAMVAPFVGNYRVTYIADPKCDSCAGSVCYANSVDVTTTTIGYNTSGKEYTQSNVGTETLRPLETWDALETGNQQYLNIRFIKGEASASACPESGMIIGPQPVSEFFIRSMSTASAVPTTEETTAVPATLPETEATTPVATATTAAPTPTPTPGFGVLVAALGCIAAMVVIRR